MKADAPAAIFSRQSRHLRPAALPIAAFSQFERCQRANKPTECRLVILYPHYSDSADRLARIAVAADRAGVGRQSLALRGAPLQPDRDVLQPNAAFNHR